MPAVPYVCTATTLVLYVAVDRLEPTTRAALTAWLTEAKVDLARLALGLPIDRDLDRGCLTWRAIDPNTGDVQRISHYLPRPMGTWPPPFPDVLTISADPPESNTGRCGDSRHERPDRGTMSVMSDDPHTAADVEFGGCGDPACPTGDHDGSVVDLDATDVRLADGTRLTNEVAEQLVDEIRASAAKLHDPKV